MGTWKTLGCSICGFAICAHLAHERHHDADHIARLLAPKPALDSVGYFRLPHGEEPAAPGGPLRTAWTIAATSGSTLPAATITVAGMPPSVTAGSFHWPTSPTAKSS